MSRSHLVIPDTQDRAGVPKDHLLAIGNFIVEHRPSVVVHVGDHWDFPSLSRYDSPVKKAAEGACFEEDLESANEGMDLIRGTVQRYNRSTSHRKRRRVEWHYTLGNHDVRLLRAAEAEPWMKKTYSLKRLNLKGWTVHPFLEPVVIDGVAYAHFFPRAASGGIFNNRRGAPSAKAQIQREARSCTAGHRQGLDVAVLPVGGGRIHRGVIAGSCYQHDEDYLTPQQVYWRGILFKRHVRGGEYDLAEISIDQLRSKYL